MRKYIRNILRADAKKEKAKPSRWLRAAWQVHQDKKYGVERRKANQAKGTHPKHLWGSRVALFAQR